MVKKKIKLKSNMKTNGTVKVRRCRITKAYKIGFIACCLAATLAFRLNGSGQVKAYTNNVELKENVTEAIHNMQGVMENSYESKEKEMESLVKENGYDYELTAESFYNQGMPFANYDYERFIAAYATITNYCVKNNISMGEGINSIQFVNMDYTAETEKEYIPKKYDTFIKFGEGNEYVKNNECIVSEPCTVPAYKETSKGIYVPDGTQEITLDTKDTPYASITLSTISVDDVYKTFGLNRSDFEDEENKRYNLIMEALGKADPGQTVFINNGLDVTQDDVDVINSALSATDNSQRKSMINTASSIIGMVPYEWGGKSDKAGFDKLWYTFDSTGRQKGLDCSGFIQWVLRTTGYKNWSDLSSTSDFLTSDQLIMVQSSDLQPGDFGLLYPIGTDQTNHIGMYLGNGEWIHCSSGKDTVAISDNINFSVYRRLKCLDDPSDDEFADAGIETETSEVPSDNTDVKPQYTENQSIKCDDSSLMLMAKIVQCESYSEGYNGWIGVAQVIRDRMLSDKFDVSSVYDVVSSPKQFATYEKASHMPDSDVDPSVIEVCKKVMQGNLEIFPNDNVIAFRRNDGSDTFNGWPLYTVLGNHAFYTL
jgi:hypothetical protein